MSKELVLELNNIRKVFPGVVALDGVELKLHRGEVLGLIGENGAGKSTLMNVLIGSLKPDNGTMIFKGEPYNPSNPNNALKTGISMVHQEISLVPSMSVIDNIWLGREEMFTKLGIVSFKEKRKKTYELLEKFKISLDIDKNVGSLTIANTQLVEILRAASYNPDVIILDEPTSSLTDNEINKLFDIIKYLTEQGTAVIYITHKLEELFIVCDRITVFRDGKYVTSKNIEDTTKNQLVSLMVGRELTNLFPKEEVEHGEEILKCQKLGIDGVFNDINFSVKAGEILGFMGLVGAKRTELMESIFGLTKLDRGTMYLRGQEITNKSAKEAIKHKFAFVTEDRFKTGGIHSLPIKLNMSLAYLNEITKLGFVNQRQETRDTRRMVDAMQIKISSEQNPLSSLSGGNQQKVIIGKWLLTEPEIFILDEPTRGIDVGSKAEIYKLIGNLVKEGKAVILISSELAELMGLSDNIVVLREGKQMAYIKREDFNQDKLMSYAFGVVE